MMRLKLEEIRQLAQVEREMDSGAQPFVNFNGRWAVQPEAMAALGLVSGQTVNHAIITEILRWQIAWCQEKSVEREAQKPITIGPDFLETVSDADRQG